MHNSLLRGINSVYLQCLNVERSPGHVLAFVEYASSWSRILHHHHSTEEQYVFPEIDAITGEKGLMDANVEQHHAFEKGVEQYTLYLKRVEEGKEKYEGAKLRTMIDSFMPILRQHLFDEILTLKALEKYADKTDWGKWTEDVLNKVVKNPNF